MTRYSIDTSALIDGLERYYPAKHFPKLWELVDELVDDGRFLISEEVWREAQSKDATVKDWCNDPRKSRDSCKVPTNDAIGAVAGEIMAQHPSWVTQGQKNGADPFVIAVGEVLSAQVISGERNGGPSKPKIPYVCKQRGLPYGRFIDINITEGWVLG